MIWPADVSRITDPDIVTAVTGLWQAVQIYIMATWTRRREMRDVSVRSMYVSARKAVFVKTVAVQLDTIRVLGTYYINI